MAVRKALAISVINLMIFYVNNNSINWSVIDNVKIETHTSHAQIHDPCPLQEQAYSHTAKKENGILKKESQICNPGRLP